MSYQKLLEHNTSIIDVIMTLAKEKWAQHHVDENGALVTKILWDPLCDGRSRVGMVVMGMEWGISICPFRIFGLSYVERPILGDHPKAHTLKTGGFHMKSSSFHEKWWFSCEKQWFSYGNLINQLTQHKFFSLMVCWGEGMSQDSMKTATFHENCHFS